MNTRKATIYLLFATGLIWIVWDIYVFIEPTGQDTISEVTRDAGARSWLILVASGTFIGHFFWPRPGKGQKILALATVTLLLSAWDALAYFAPIDPFFTIHQTGTRLWYILIVTGTFLGHFLWPLEPDAQEDT